jgi:hypothetical protein
MRVVAGFGEGGVVAPIRLAAASSVTAGTLPDRICRIVSLDTDAAQTTIKTAEKELRERDDSFAQIMLVEALDDIALANAVAALPQAKGLTAQHWTYELVFAA